MYELQLTGHRLFITFCSGRPPPSNRKWIIGKGHELDICGTP
jgi:hypothetical protein